MKRTPTEASEHTGKGKARKTVTGLPKGQGAIKISTKVMST